MKVWRSRYAAPLAGTAGLAVALMMGAAPAYSVSPSGDEDVNVELLATIDTQVYITVDEDINITKTIDLTAVVNDAVGKFAEANADVTQTNVGNLACENCAERTDTLERSANGDTGITTINQAGGNFNNQAAAVSGAIDHSVTPPPPPVNTPTGFGFAEATASASQENFNNEILVLNILFRDALIDASVVGDHGITLVNQAVGNMNNQSNEIALALSKQPDGVAMSEADLGQANTGLDSETPEHVGENNVSKSVEIQNGSISGNTGIVGVNQAAGNFANQANLVSFAAVAP